MLCKPLDSACVRRFWQHCLRLGEAPDDQEAPTRQPTGLPPLDAALGGGLASGQIALVQGGIGVGKTSLCLTLTAQAQGRGRAAAWLDLDGTLDAKRAQAHGVDAAAWVIPCGDPCEALTKATALLEGGHVDWLVIDAWPPWPLWRAPAAIRQALRTLARAADRAQAIVLIAQPTRDADAQAQVHDARNELIYIASTHLVLGLSRGTRLRRNALSAPQPTRITVSKRAGLPRPNGEPMCTFIVPFWWDRGCQMGSAANNWRYI